jgi:hypothetical protein
MDVPFLCSQVDVPSHRRVQELLRTTLSGARDEEFARLARAAGVNQRDLKTLSLLYLPRLGSSSVLTQQDVRNEIRRVSVFLRRRGEFEPEPNSIAPLVHDLSQLAFSQIPEEVASSIVRKYHYLGSSRRNSTHFGLTLPSVKKRNLCAVLTLSRFDLWHIPLPYGSRFGPSQGDLAHLCF